MRLILALLTLLSAPALGETCTASVQGATVSISFERDGWFRYGVNGFQRGHLTRTGQCPPFVVLQYFVGAGAATKGRCLYRDSRSGTYIAAGTGERSPIGKLCVRSFCEMVEVSQSLLNGVSSTAEPAASAASAALAAKGLSAVPHASGRLIITQGGRYVAGTLGTEAATAVGIATSPATATIATVLAAGAGLAIWSCSAAP